ncbi:MAG: hypothetical protein JXB32_21635 [Deltaproteobacteria bacterium]|nr:hypothetical protein [Deltaproteobacteria bacterium]
MSGWAPSGVWRVLWVILAVAACRTDGPDTGILPLDGLALRALRPGATATVTGSGFVPGPATLELSGTVSQPGAPPRPWTFSVAASATSDRELVALLPEGVVDVLQATHGRFRGSATVRFPPPATPGLPPLVGRHDGLSLPMVSEVPAAQAVRAELEEAAQRFLEQLGVEVTVEAPGRPGGERRVVVQRVRDPQPPLDELRPGDRLAELDGIPVSSLADLAPNPDAAWITLTAAEAESGRPFELHLGLRAADETFPAADALALFVVLAVLGLVLYLHFAGCSDVLARALAFPLVRRAPALPEPDAGSGSRRPRWPGLLAAGTSLGAAAAAPALFYRAGQAWPVLGLWAVAVAALLVHRLAHAVGDLLRERATPWTWLTRSFGALASAGAAALPLTACVALVLWNAAALTAGGAVAAQEALPPAWAALRDPFALLLACLALVRLGPSFAPGQPGWRTAVDAAATLPACLLLALIGFGGWNAGPFEPAAFGGLPVGAWVFEGKVLLLVALAAWYGRRRWARGRDPRAAGLGWLAALPLGAASVMLEQLVPTAWYAAVVEPATVGLLGALLLALWLGHRQQAEPAILEIRVDAG